MMNELPELCRIIRNGLGSLGDGMRIGLEKNVFELAFIAIEPDVFTSVTERARRPGPFLITCRFREEILAFHFDPGNYFPGNSMVFDLEKPELLACFGDGFAELRPLEAEIDDRNSEGPGLGFLPS